MLNEKSWNMLTEQMFEEAYSKFVETDTNKAFCSRYGEMTDELFEKYNNTTANKLHAYLYELDTLSKYRAKELYLMGMNDVVLLLKKLNVLM